MASCIVDPKNELTYEVMFPSQAVAANGNSAVIDLKNYEGKVAVVFNCSQATAGTSPTLDIRFMSGAESNGANATNLNINTTQVTGSGGNVFETISIDTASANRYLKAVAIIGGTNSPSFPAAMSVVGQKKSQ